MLSLEAARVMAEAIRKEMAAAGLAIGEDEALAIVTRQLGLKARVSAGVKAGAAPRAAASPDEDRGAEAEADAADPGVVFRTPIPIFRIFDEAKAREFYLGFLGCRIDWEHRFSAEAPLYMQVSRGDLVLHLSEHSGDATPGANAVVYTKNVAGLQAELAAKDYKYNRPGLLRQDWGDEVGVIDPFGNRLRFIEPVRES